MTGSGTGKSRFISRLHAVENAFLTVLFMILVCLAFCQIAGRLILKIGFSWADPIIYNLVLWIGLLGAAIATREQSHITIDVFTRFMSPRWKHATFCITYLFSSFVCGVLTWAGYRFTLDEADMGTMVSGKIPAWIFQLIIPAAFGIMSVRYFLQSIGNGISFFRKEEAA